MILLKGINGLRLARRHQFNWGTPEHLSVYQTSPELWEREAFEEKLDGAPEATGEPGKSSAGELGGLAVRAFFFGRGWIVGVVRHAGRDRPVEGESHDQYQAGETVGIAQMGLLETKPARFEIRKQGLDAPARGVSQGGEISRLGRHGDNPGLGMPQDRG